MDQAVVMRPEIAAGLRDGRLSLLRLIGTVMVITVHVSGMVAADARHPYRMAGILYDAFSRACVPLFLMITGALLLPRSLRYGTYLYRRAARLLVPLLVWAVFYLRAAGVPVGAWPEKLLAAQPEGFHLWYLYMLVNISLGLPVVAAFFRTAQQRDCWVLLAVWFVVCTVFPFWYVLGVDFDWPGQGFLSSVHDAMQAAAAGLFSPYLGYVLLGACLARTRGSPGWGAAAYAAASVGIAAVTWSASLQAPATLPVDDFLSPLVVVASAGLFLCVMGVPIREPSWLCWLSDCSFGIYLVHLYGIRVAASWGFNALGGNSWITIAETVAVVFAGALCFTAAIRAMWLGRLVT